MDFTRITCIAQNCVNKNIIMEGAGGSFGGRVTISKVRCPECGLTLMIIPMNKEYQYEISASTEEDRIQERIEKARTESELELARKINQIKTTKS